MKAIIKKGIRDYIKNPIFWIGVFYVMIGIYQNTAQYLNIHYFEPEQELQELPDSKLGDADIMDGYILATPEKRRELWEKYIYQNLVNEFEMSPSEAEEVIKKIGSYSIIEADQYLEENYSYCMARAAYYDESMQYYQGDISEINQYIKSKLKEHSYSYYFSRKFADFCGLYLGFFAIIFFSFLFWQDTRKSTYELLHTKPISAVHYIAGKIISGFLLILLMLILLNIVFFILCNRAAKESGFSVAIWDFLVATILYILPCIMMILCVYTSLALLFKNPFPVMPLLFLYMIYSNLGSRNGEGIFGYYGRPLAILIRFPGKFFDTQIPKIAFYNQIFLVISCIILFLFSVNLWKRRRTY